MLLHIEFTQINTIIISSMSENFQLSNLIQKGMGWYYLIPFCYYTVTPKATKFENSQKYPNPTQLLQRRGHFEMQGLVFISSSMYSNKCRKCLISPFPFKILISRRSVSEFWWMSSLRLEIQRSSWCGRKHVSRFYSAWDLTFSFNLDFQFHIRVTYY